MTRGVSGPRDGEDHFSARDYADRRAAEICEELSRPGEKAAGR